MKTYNLYTYKPLRYRASADEKKVRNFIYDFKSGEQPAIEYAAQIISRALGYRGGDVFACIPASSEAATAKRYEYFSYLVCKSTGMMNGYRHIHVNGEKKALHNCKKGQSDFSHYSISVDDVFFADKKVIIFDDIITRGISLHKFASQLEDKGAEILGGIFLAQTYHAKLNN
jgi:predicted amidophosphoribosyltransferase